MGLTVKQVEKLIRDAAPGATADGDGLYLKITPTGSASWQYRYQINGKRRMMGLGPCSQVTLAQARDAAADKRRVVKSGIDPLDAQAAEYLAEKAKKLTFRELTEQYIENHRPSWSSAKHAHDWKSSVVQYAYPTIGEKPPEQITTADILEILKPIWSSRGVTADRVRNRIELVIDSARAQGLSDKPNPAVWRGHLKMLLPKLTADKKHHAAMDYSDLPAFYAKLGDTLPSKALMLTILTACRTSEVLEAKWVEFDLPAKLWTIPPERMKARKEHRVPLSEAAIQLLEGLTSKEGYIFPGTIKDKPVSELTMLRVLKNNWPIKLTVHGFRSTFRDWASEETHYPNMVAEQALAHMVGNAVENAYRRGDLLEKRRALMADWASYCTKKPASNVVPIKSNTAA